MIDAFVSSFIAFTFRTCFPSSLLYVYVLMNLNRSTARTTLRSIRYILIRPNNNRPLPISQLNLKFSDVLLLRCTSTVFFGFLFRGNWLNSGPTIRLLVPLRNWIADSNHSETAMSYT